MSEFINNQTEKRVNDLLHFSQGIMAGEDGKELIDKYSEAIKNITPQDVLNMEDKQVRMGVEPALIKKHIEKIMNVFNPYLENYNWNKPEEGHPLYYLMEENRKLEDVLAKSKEIIKKIVSKKNQNINKAKEIEKLGQFVSRLKEFNRHYIKKENILFPYLEKKWDDYKPLQVMWSLHDDIRDCWKELSYLLEDKEDLNKEIHRKFADLFSLMYRMIFKEEKIIFPVAMETLNKKEWQEIQKQSLEIGYVYIATPKKLILKESSEEIITDNNQKADIGAKVMRTDTGSLTLDEVNLLINKLPLDLTYVDENDKVKYFSKPAERFFPRSAAIIGRSVQNCHPPESVHIVDNILKSFKSGEKDRARFWIQIKGKFILIEYFAIRDNEGKYKGTLEVSQDITEYRDMAGEKRLLDW